MIVFSKYQCKLITGFISWSKSIVSQFGTSITALKIAR